MNDTRLRVLVKGLLFSGSGAVVDLLKEYDGTIQVPGGPGRFAPAGNWELGEFNDFDGIGMVGEQLLADRRFVQEPRIHLKVRRQKRQLGPVAQAKRIAKTILLGKPDQVSFLLRQNRQLIALNGCLERLAIGLDENPDLSVRMKLAREWIREQIDVLDDDSARRVIFDQPFNFSQFDEIWPIVFDPFKLIIVHRDPRDQFAELHEHGLIYNKWGGNFGYIYGWDMIGAFQFFIDAIAAMMKAVDATIERLGRGKAMLIRFEDIVTDYEQSMRRIQEFVGLTDEEHTTPGKYLDPGWSKRNIGIHERITLPIPDSMLDGLMSWYRAHA